MRAASLLLLLSLIAPSAGRAICGARCSAADHQAVPSASVEGCHQPDNSQGDAAAISGADTACHGNPPALEARLAERLVPVTAPALARSPEVTSLGHVRGPAGPACSFRQPDIVLITTQRRI